MTALHESLNPHPDEGLADHDPTICLECTINSPPLGKDKSSTPPPTTNKAIGRLNLASKGLLNSFGNTFKAKTVEMKGKLMDYIVHPTASSADERHVKSTDKDKSKPYRNLTSVFSLENEGDSPDGYLSSFPFLVFYEKQ